jgi:hypothetical protein
MFINNEHVGELTLENAKMPLGIREFLFRHPEEGERRQIVVVTMKAPVTVKYAEGERAPAR